jgi:hypothetical protein
MRANKYYNFVKNNYLTFKTAIFSEKLISVLCFLHSLSQIIPNLILFYSTIPYIMLIVIDLVFDLTNEYILGEFFRNIHKQLILAFEGQ